MTTELGKILRKIRIDHGEVLKDMADKLHVSSSYLSAVEVGKRNIPGHWIEELIRFYSLESFVAEKLRALSEESLKSIKLNIEGIDQAKRRVALVFARSFEEMDAETAEKLIQMLKKES